MAQHRCCLLQANFCAQAWPRKEVYFCEPYTRSNCRARLKSNNLHPRNIHGKRQTTQQGTCPNGTLHCGYDNLCAFHALLLPSSRFFSKLVSPDVMSLMKFPIPSDVLQLDPSGHEHGCAWSGSIFRHHFTRVHLYCVGLPGLWLATKDVHDDCDEGNDDYDHSQQVMRSKSSSFADRA